MNSELRPFRPQLLLVGSDHSTIEALRSVLRGKEYDVNSASTSASAVEKMRSKPMDLVILILNGAGVDEWETIRCLKEADPSVATVIIAPAACRIEERAAVEVDAIFKKPVDVHVFVRVVRELSRRRGKRASDGGTDVDWQYEYQSEGMTQAICQLQARWSVPLELSESLRCRLLKSRPWPATFRTTRETALRCEKWTDA